MDGTLLSGSESIDGADDDDLYTGLWEVSVIPTNGKVQNEWTSVGFYRNSDGTAGTIYSSGTDSAGATSGFCKANGTTNPVIAYKTANEMDIQILEVAQRK